MKYYFLHPKTLKVYDVYNGRSIWEDDFYKSEYLVVKVLGPALEHWEEALKLSQIEERLLDDIRTDLSTRGYGEDFIQFVLKKIQK